MDIERRLETKRMDAQRPLEISCLDTGIAYIGHSYNVSDGGMGATLRAAPTAGSNVLVKLYWDTAATPVESFGRIAWKDTLPAGEGLNVGLMLGADYSPLEHATRRQDRSTRRLTARRNRCSKTKNVPSFSAEANSHGIDNKEEFHGIHGDVDTTMATKKTVAAVDLLSRTSVDRCIDLVDGNQFRVRLGHVARWCVITSVGKVNAQGDVLLKLNLVNDEAQTDTPTAPHLNGHTFATDDDDVDYVGWQKTPFDHLKDILSRIWGLRASRRLAEGLRASRRLAEGLRASRRLAHPAWVTVKRSGVYVWQKTPVLLRARILDVLDSRRRP